MAYFKSGTDISLYGNLDKQVGTSNFITWVADPQPAPELRISTPKTFEMVSIQKPILTSKSSMEYINSNGESLGGITNLTFSEIAILLKKHSS